MNSAAPETVALKPKNVRRARLFADREHLVRSLRVRKGGVVAEVGVALGDFSDVMIRRLRPSKFVAFDLFNMHEYPEHWGTPSDVLFGGLTHLDFYRRRFADLGDQVVTEVGLSYHSLATYADRTFDLIYIDAGHYYEDVRRDAVLSAAKLKPGGVLVFNDYIMYDHSLGVPYGVVQVVNEMVVNEGWRVVGLGLQKDMFCDIAIRPRRSADLRRRFSS